MTKRTTSINLSFPCFPLMIYDFWVLMLFIINKEKNYREDSEVIDFPMIYFWFFPTGNSSWEKNFLLKFSFKFNKCRWNFCLHNLPESESTRKKLLNYSAFCSSKWQKRNRKKLFNSVCCTRKNFYIVCVIHTWWSTFVDLCLCREKKSINILSMQTFGVHMCHLLFMFLITYSINIYFRLSHLNH